MNPSQGVRDTWKQVFHFNLFSLLHWMLPRYGNVCVLSICLGKLIAFIELPLHFVREKVLIKLCMRAPQKREKSVWLRRFEWNEKLAQKQSEQFFWGCRKHIRQTMQLKLCSIYELFLFFDNMQITAPCCR